MDELEESCPSIPLSKILKATNDFDEALVIGTGGFGKVYKAIIGDGATTTVAAIKRLNAKSNQGAEEFWTEIKLLSKLHHTNLISLIGYCNENQEMVLLYDYMACGTLASHLYKSSREESGGRRSHVTWERRLNICLGAARGLDYLHNGTKQGIIHRDVKSTNILLDKNLVAKVSDFGICKCFASQTTTHVTTKVKATRGYWDPDYLKTGRVTKKSDVYAFGVVLLEVLCGRKPLDERLEDEQSSLILWAQMYIKMGKLDRIIDPSLNGEITPQSLKYFAELATKCLHTEPKERPTMAEVVKSLDIALKSHVRKGRLQGTIPMAFRGIKVVPKGMNLWWRVGKGSGSNDGEGPILDDLTRSVYPRFSLAEIRAATNDFNAGLLICKDSFFTVYKGCMVEGSHAVIIKRYKSRMAIAEQVSAEIAVQSLTCHPNMVSLRGTCEEKNELILVYNCMINGTLESHLHETDKDPLSWKKRLEICIDTARGLEFLHTNSEEQFIHCNIKPSNIFLDDKWVAKIAGCELALPIPTSMETEGIDDCTRGTVGYLDPEYLGSGKVTKESDVYSFGVVLLEVLCAKTPVQKRNKDEFFLVNWFCSCIERRTINEVIDPYLIRKIAPECLRHYVNISLSCLHLERIRRPAMSDVLGILQSSLQIQVAWQNSYNNTTPKQYTIVGQDYLISDLIRTYVLDNEFSPGSNDGDGPILDDLTRSVYPRFSLAEIRIATNNFSAGLLMYNDKWFTMYMGCMVEGSHAVVIKRYKSRRGRVKQVRAEIAGRCHPNMVSLRGTCEEKNELILVYDCMENGTLQIHLHQTNKDPLSWKKRLEICIATARGLEFLHTNLEEEFIYDIKPSNILLDDKWVAKIGGYELALPIPTSMDTEGIYDYPSRTFVYADHAYLFSQKATKRSDVYSFGVVLLEVLCAKTPVQENRDGLFLVDWFCSCIERGTIDEVIDLCLIGKVAPECLRHYVNIALSCLHRERIRRPTMSDVLGSLESSLQIQETWENSFLIGDELLMAVVPQSYNDIFCTMVPRCCMSSVIQTYAIFG